MALRRRREPAFDPHELGARRSDPTLAGLEPLPMPPRRISPVRLLALFAVAVFALAFFRDGLGRGAPDVDGSCTSPAFALDKTTTKPHAAMKWSARGPADASVVLGLDTTTLPPDGDAKRLAGPVRLTDCAADGLFGVAAEPGEHVLTAFLVREDGSSTVLERVDLEVEEP